MLSGAAHCSVGMRTVSFDIRKVKSETMAKGVSICGVRQNRFAFVITKFAAACRPGCMLIDFQKGFLVVFLRSLLIKILLSS